MKNWFNNLKVAHKLMLISVFFVMPDSVMLYLFITQINAVIQFARMEKKGNEYQRPLEQLLELIPQHRQLAGSLPAGSLPLIAKRNEIDAAFDKLEAVDARIGADLQFTDEGLAKRKREHYKARTVRGEWIDLKSKLPSLKPEERLERHRHLVADIRMMITHAGDNSNLILDPDLDSYYLMDATLLALPQTQDRLAIIMVYAETALKDAELSQLERQQFAVYEELLREADLERVQKSLEFALTEDPNFYGPSDSLQSRVPPALKEYTNASESLIRLIHELVASEKLVVSREALLAAGSNARDASFKLWNIADIEVDTLLQKRIDACTDRRARSLIVAACALLAAIGFVTFITRSISGPLHLQAAELRRANEALQAEIAERKTATEKVAELNTQLVISARQSGMAEVASSVLHNAGNVLNSVNVSATLVTDRIKHSRLSGLSKAAQMLSEHSTGLGEFLTNDPRGRQLPAYIKILADHWRDEQAKALEELEHLNQSIQHVKDIIAAQQSLTGVSGFEEPVKINHVVDNALKIVAASFEHNSITIQRDYAEIPATLIDKSKLLQILINLLQNAKDAVADRELKSKTIVITTRRDEDTFKIEVTDNGMGIRPEDLTRIFSFGFTTKAKGHGIGLHISALGAKDLGGSLTASSAGTDQGAAFVLKLPHKTAEAEAQK